MNRWHVPPYGLVLALAGCTGVQSTLDPRGPHAAQISLLWWIMVAGAGAILALVAIATISALFSPPPRRRWLGRETIVVTGGLVLPSVTLALLLAYGFAATRTGQAILPPGEPLRIAVIGEQWWWRVVYLETSLPRIESANEIRIPTGRAIELTLSTADVIHSFWVPHLAGKLDMIPGRTTTLHLAANMPGISRGQCAEYCGGAHALMSFHVIAMPPEDFEAWWRRESAPAGPATDPIARAGEALFLAGGCGACHRIRGTDADGTIGPDLTHVGARISIAAAVLPNDATAHARWIADNQHIKPENRMPPFRIFGDEELAALATYLAGLK